MNNNNNNKLYLTVMAQVESCVIIVLYIFACCRPLPLRCGRSRVRKRKRKVASEIITVIIITVITLCINTLIIISLPRLFCLKGYKLVVLFFSDSNPVGIYRCCCSKCQQCEGCRCFAASRNNSCQFSYTVVNDKFSYSGLLHPEYLENTVIFPLSVCA